MSHRKNKTPPKPTLNKLTPRTPTPIPHATSTMLADPSDQNLNIALQLAEHHKKQAYLYKEKCEVIQTKFKDKQQELQKIKEDMKAVQEDNERLLKKYKKVKTKYKTKKNQQQLEPASPIFQKYPEEDHEETAVSKEYLSMVHELNNKNKMINILSDKVEECQSNTLEILQLVSVLEQRVQELTMDNNLLRGVVRDKCRVISTSSREVTVD